MKKFLLFLIISLTSLFIFNENVSAANTDLGTLQVNSSFFDSIISWNDYVPSADYPNYTTGFENLYNYMNINFDTEDYIIYRSLNESSYYLIGYKWPKDYQFNLKPGIYTGNYNGQGTTSYIGFNLLPSSTFVQYTWSDGSGITTRNISTSMLNSVVSIDNSKTTLTGDIYYFNKTTTTNKFIYSSSVPLKFYYNDTGISNTYWNYNFSTLQIKDNNDEIFVLNSGDILFDENGIASWEEKTPTINISKTSEELTENNEKISETININFSIFDTEKYVYFYSTSTGEIKTWVDILENDFEYTSYSNGTLYLAVVDYEKYIESAENGEDLVFDYIATATYEFANIIDLVPDFRFEHEVPDSCYLAIGGKQEIICKRVKIDILNYYDFEKYLVQYSTDGLNFTTLYTNQYTKVFSENVVLYFQILDRTTNEYIKYMTYTLSGISTNMSSIGPYISLKGKYNEEKYLYEVTGYFYNYDSSLYNYYYSTDRENWTEIGQFELNIYSGADSSAIYYKTFDIYEDCTFYIKIEDKNGNYIYSTTMTIKMKEHGSNNLLNIFNNNADYDENIWSTLNNTYTKLRKSSIGTYIYLVIISSLIILIVKMFNR